MRIRNRFPSFPVIPSSVTSSKEVQSQLEEMEVSSFPAPAEGTAREAPQKVLSDWQSITTEAHRLLGCSSYTSKYHTNRPHVQEEHSSDNAVSNGETVSEIQSTKKRSKKSPLEKENPSQTMVIEHGGGNAGKQIFDLFSNSQVKGNCSGTAVSNTKQTAVSSSFSKGDVNGIFSGNSIARKAESIKRIGGGTGRKERTNILCSTEAGSSGRASANGSRRLKCKDNAGDEEQYSSTSFGDVKGIFSGNSLDRKAESGERIGGGTGQKERTNVSCFMEAGSSGHASANGSRGLKCKDKAEDEEHYSCASSGKKKAKTRSLTSIYDDIRSLIPFSSMLNEIEEISNEK